MGYQERSSVREERVKEAEESWVITAELNVRRRGEDRAVVRPWDTELAVLFRARGKSMVKNPLRNFWVTPCGRISGPRQELNPGHDSQGAVEPLEPGDLPGDKLLF